MQCTLCAHDDLEELMIARDKRTYFHCPYCRLVMAHPKQLPSPEDEAKRYLEHNNSVENKGYVAFLRRVITPMLPYLNNKMTGLDYGCGPMPTLSKILASYTIKCHNYDPIFNIGHPHLAYDFIFATECLEHFFSPQRELERIATLLLPGGYLGIMTETYENLDRFKTWYYKNDHTHVSFYHAKTMAYIEEAYQLEKVHQDGNRVFIFKKNALD